MHHALGNHLNAVLRVDYDRGSLDRGQRILMETLKIERPQAADLLERAGGHVKTALVMGKLNLNADQARARLAESGGVISSIVGDVSGAPGAART